MYYVILPVILIFMQLKMLLNIKVKAVQKHKHYVDS